MLLCKQFGLAATGKPCVDLPSSSETLTLCFLHSRLPVVRPALPCSPAHSPNSTPGLCRLTALQELEIHGSDSHCCFHVSALPALPALRKLALSSCPFIAGGHQGCESCVHIWECHALQNPSTLHVATCMFVPLKASAAFVTVDALPTSLQEEGCVMHCCVVSRLL